MSLCDFLFLFFVESVGTPHALNALIAGFRSVQIKRVVAGVVVLLRGFCGEMLFGLRVGNQEVKEHLLHNFSSEAFELLLFYQLVPDILPVDGQQVKLLHLLLVDLFGCEG